MSAESPFQSKKFCAFVLSEATWKILAGLVLFWGKDAMTTQVWAILLAIIIVAGFVESGFIIGQASLDRYLKVAELAVGAGHEISIGDMKSQKPTTAKVLDSAVVAPVEPQQAPGPEGR